MRQLIYGSVTSGIEAATVAWHPLGWKAAWFSEIEPFPCKVLKYHYPEIPNLGDMLQLRKNSFFNESNINVLVGGTPCQSFSLAGLRRGLADDRGNLALEYCRLLIAGRPDWFVWENVPGVLSSFSGEAPGEDVPFWQTADFATLLEAFRDCGYCCTWRVLDSQYFGVPQRRRRVFVVGHLGDDWRPSAAVLLEPQSLQGNYSTISQEKKSIAGGLNASSGRSRGAGTDIGMIVGTLSARQSGGGFPGTDEALSGYIQPCWWDGGQISQTLDAVLYKGQTMPEKNRFPAVLVPSLGFNTKTIVKPDNATNLTDKALSLDTQGGASVLHHTTVRRLTPLECERLQGFPDHYTAIPGASDGPRYKALGNSMTTQVMQWIGRRIQKVDAIIH